MRSLAWQGLLLLLSGWVSWWIFLRVPPAPASPGAREPATVLNVLPLVREAAASTPTTSRPASAAPPSIQSEPEALFVPPVPVPEELGAPAGTEAPELAQAPDTPVPPPSELGTPEGNEDEAGLPVEEQQEIVAPEGQTATQPTRAEDSTEALAETSARSGDEQAGDEQADEPVSSALDLPDAMPQEPDAPGGGTSPAREDGQEQGPGVEESTSTRTARAAVEELMHDPALIAAARAEFAAGNRRGFTTVLLAAPEEQIEIARFFGEELVLVPRAALDPANPEPTYFRLTGRGAAVVERVDGAPRLEDYRQYRDLFDYEYARLPAPLRDLRRSLVARGEVVLFAALLSAEEWALVIARRSAALERAGRELADVRRFVLRYARLPGGGFDLCAQEIVFADGSRFVPGRPGKGDG